MKNLLLTIILFLLTGSIYSQVVQEYIGRPGFKGFANKSAILTDGKRVVAGMTTGSSGDNDAFITCLAPTGNVLWSREISTPQHDRFISVTATSDGGCVAAGYVAADLSSPFLNTQGAVYKFDNSGSIVWYKTVEITSYGEIFHTVIEDPITKNIICGGVSNFGSTSSCLIINFTPTGTINWAKTYYGSSETIMDIQYFNGNLICAGLFKASGHQDGRLFSVKEVDGTVNWNRVFDYSSAYNPTVRSNFFDRLSIVENKIYIDAFISPNYGTPSPGLAITPTLMSLDTNGLNPFCLEYPVGSSTYANVVHSKVVSKNEIYLFQHISSNHWERVYSAAPVINITDAICTKIKDITDASGSLVYTRKFGNTGEQGLTTATVEGGKIVAWGGANSDPANLNGTQDIFKIEADTALPVSAITCVENVSGQRFAYPTVTINPAATFSSITTVALLTAVVPTVTNVTYNRKFPCKLSIVPDFSYLQKTCYTYDFTDLSVPGVSGFKTWAWSFGDGTGSSIQNPTHTYPGPGSFTVKLVVTDSLGNKDSVSKILLINKIKFANAGNDTALCLTSDSIKIALNASGGVSYQWSPSTGLSDAMVSDPVATVKKPIWYAVTVTDMWGCIDTDSIYINAQSSTIIVNPKKVFMCEGASAQLYASGMNSYEWVPETGLSNSKIHNPVTSVSSSITYYVKGTSLNGCTDEDTLEVTVYPHPVVSITSTDIATDCFKEVILEAKGALTYTWEPHIFTENSNGSKTRAFPSSTTLFTVTGVDSNGCTSQDTLTIGAQGKTTVLMPKAFTPNKDNINDNIKPIVICNFVLVEFSIYNRWGQLVFQTTDLRKAWNGEFNGRECEIGVYYYMIKGKDSKSEDILLKGDITLLR